MYLNTARVASLALTLVLACVSTVASAASPPSLSGVPPTSVAVGTAYSFAPTARDPDGDRLSFFLKNRPAWMTLDGRTGRLGGTPTSTGTYSNLQLVVYDGTYYRSLPEFTVTVTGAPAGSGGGGGSGGGSGGGGSGGGGPVPPTISGQPPTSVAAGTAYSFTPTASDANGDRLSFGLRNRPSWMTVDAATGRLGGTPAAPNVGTYSRLKLTVYDGVYYRSLPEFSVTVTPAGSSSNSPPKISGTPPTSVVAGTAYSFTPTASDANGDKLTFTIANKPSWATFSTSTGRLYGTPSASAVGTYANVAIGVSDGKATASLPAHSIAVVQSGSANGSVTLSWAPPTRNTDGSTLTTLAGYRFYYGTSPTSLTRTAQVANAGLSSYVIGSLTSGTWYFAMTAYTSTGLESARTSVVSKVVQ